VSHLCSCGKPVNGAAICTDCTKALEIALGNISAYWADLDNVKGRNTRYGDRNGGASFEKPLLMDARFAALEWVTIIDEATEQVSWTPRVPAGTALTDAVKSTIATWTRTVMDERPVLYGPVHATCLHLSCSQARRSKWPTDTVTGCCRYLLGHADWIRGKEWAPDMLDELDHLEQRLSNLVDRPADKWYAGPCDGCERDLYAKAGAPSVTCEDCDRPYDVTARREWLLREAHDRYATASELARAVSWLGTEPLTAERVRKWAERGRITARGSVTIRGRELPTYLVGDAVALLAQDTRPKAG